VNRERLLGGNASFLQVNLFPSLSINSLTSLSMSRENRQSVLRHVPTRVSYWKKTWFPQMGYETGMSKQIPARRRICVVVTQLQTFRFLFRTDEVGGIYTDRNYAAK
jgi:hypothetical protein